MDMHELVATIVRQVLEQLQKDASFSGEAQAAARPCVMVLAPRNESIAAGLKENFGKGVEIRFFGEETVKAEPVRYILPLLACGELAELAAGKASGIFTSEALRLLLSGKKVEVLEFEYKAYSQSAPSPLYRLYESYEKTLASYGMVMFRCKMPEVFRFRDSLVTEKTVETARKNGAKSIMVPAAAIVTPLARDAAKNLNIEILKRL